MSRITIIVAHPDDAEIAAGGTIARLIEQRCRVDVLVCTVSEWSSELRHLRVAAAENALLGYNLHWLFDGQHNQVEQIPVYSIVRELDVKLGALSPDLVLTHCGQDSHFDHVLLHQAVAATSRKCNWSLYYFGPCDLKTHRHLEFVPNCLVDISSYEDLKRRALDCYSYPGQGFRAIDSDEILNANRALGSVLGARLAEGFLVGIQRGLPREFL
jgi:LmbE family N-acetylglucosaminyl deacetylase